MVGYRYWTPPQATNPLLRLFGFGLSYTTFQLLQARSTRDGSLRSTVPVSFDVTNTGSVAGADVAQLLRLRSLRQSEAPGARVEGIREGSPGFPAKPGMSPLDRGRPRLQLLGRGGQQMDHRSGANS